MFDFWRINKKVKTDYKECVSGKISSDNINKILGDSSDIVEKKVFVNNKTEFDLSIFSIDGMIDQNLIDDYILKPFACADIVKTANSEKELYKLVKEGIIYHLDQKEVISLKEVIQEILSGNSVVIFNSIHKAISFDAKKLPSRSIDTPQNEGTLKGSLEAFVETLRTNTSLVRKKLKNPNLRFLSLTLGEKSNTSLEIVYINGITDEDILNKVVNKIQSLKIDNLVSDMYFTETLKNNKYSIFPEMLSTERVDKFCANLTDGKVGILIDGFSLGYIVPGVFSMFLQAPEDYSEDYLTTSFIRIIRYLCMFISLILPGFYIAITTFHQEMIPTNLLFSIINSKSGVPFPTVFEVFGMLLAFEILLEASLRLPKSIGATVSIIGGLVVGDAAVSAKFISPAVVVVIAITGIAGFVIPSPYLSNSFRLCRLFIAFMASIAGMLGLSIGLILLLYHLCKIEVFGVSYMVPYTSNEGKGLFKDTFIREPLIKENKDND